MTPVLHGYRYSVYAWIARLVLREKGVAHGWREVDPFSPDVPEQYRALHPFGRVPVLVHPDPKRGDFALYETCAIARYVDEAFPGPPLQPARARDRARMAQIVSIADSYAYRPLVRQVFAHRVFRPRLARDADEAEIAAGLAAARTVLGALDPLVEDTGAGEWRPTLADLHLAPMLGYFAAAPEGRAMLDKHPRLAAWFAAVSARDAYRETEPRLP
jgi:glutathione S-transferase